MVFSNNTKKKTRNWKIRNILFPSLNIVTNIARRVMQLGFIKSVSTMFFMFLFT